MTRIPSTSHAPCPESPLSKYPSTAQLSLKTQGFFFSSCAACAVSRCISPIDLFASFWSPRSALTCSRRVSTHIPSPKPPPPTPPPDNNKDTSETYRALAITRQPLVPLPLALLLLAQLLLLQRLGLVRAALVVCGGSVSQLAGEEGGRRARGAGRGTYGGCSLCRLRGRRRSRRSAGRAGGLRGGRGGRRGRSAWWAFLEGGGGWEVRLGVGGVVWVNKMGM